MLSEVPSQDDGVDASLPRTATSDGEAEHVVPSSRVDVISKPACAAGVEGPRVSCFCQVCGLQP